MTHLIGKPSNNFARDSADRYLVGLTVVGTGKLKHNKLYEVVGEF